MNIKMKEKSDIIDIFIKKILNMPEKTLILLQIFLPTLIFFCLTDVNPDIYFMLSHGKLLMTEGFTNIEPLTVHTGFAFSYEKWLSCICCYIVYKFSGFIGLDILCYLLLVLICFLIYKNIFLICKNKTKSAILTFVIASCYVWDFHCKRPEKISTILLLLEFYCLESYIQTEKRKFLYPLPLLSCLYMNFHSTMIPAFYLVAFPFIFENIMVPCFESIKNKKKVNNESSYNFKKLKEMIICCVICILTSLINPFGINSYIYIFNSLTSNIYSGEIIELQALSVQYFTASFIVVLFLYIIHILIGTVDTPLRYIVTIVLNLLLSLFAIRNTLFFGLFGGIVFGWYLKQSSFKIGQLKELFLYVTVPVYGAIICTMLFIRVSDCIKNNNNIIGVSPAYYFESLVEPINTPENKDERIFCDFNTGSYLEWIGFKAYIDSRAEVFTEKVNKKEDILSEYADIYYGKILLEDVQNKYDFDYYFVSKNNSIYYQIEKKTDSYKKISENDNFALYSVS